MGLDMYLNKSVFVGAKYEYRKVTGTIDLTEGEKANPIKVNLNKVSEIIEEVCYWRKANQIHNWFIQNCADGDDDCTRMEVSREQLEKLLATCKTVLAGSKLIKGKVINGQVGTQNGYENVYGDGELIENPELAQKLLPTVRGFFFGSTEYDQWYLDDLKRTVEILEEELKNNNADYYTYEASW